MFTIGELSRRTGLPVKTIRFYSDEGLLPPTGRTRAGYRLYDVNALARLELVRTLRELGIGLAEIEAVLAEAGSLPVIAAKHVEVLDEQIRLLTLRRAVLRAVTKRKSAFDEVKLMNKLAAMSDEERQRLLDDFWNEVTEGLDVDSEFYARMRGCKPDLPDDPTPEQLEAWIEFAELVRDPGFRRLIRGMGERQAEILRDNDGSMDALSKAQAEHWTNWTGQARKALDEGHAPDSAAGRKLADEITRAGTADGEADTPALRRSLADRIADGTDRRAERYWQLLGIINGWPPIPTMVPAVEWIVAALRASAQ